MLQALELKNLRDAKKALEDDLNRSHDECEALGAQVTY